MTLTSTAPATIQTRPADAAPSREPGLIRHFLGRALDTVVVIAAIVTAMLALYAAAGDVLPGADSWQGTLIGFVVLAAATFLYGGLAGTTGTLGDAVTGMVVVRTSDGTRPGFLTGGIRALGWVLYVLFALMLNDTGGIESRFVAVRRQPHTESA